MKNFSNRYIFLYVSGLVLLIAVTLTLVSLGLKPRREANVEREKMRQILKAAGYEFNKDEVPNLSALEFQELAPEHYSIRCADGSLGEVVRVQGKGLWGPIWGYVALSSDRTTIKGVAFSHKSETPGLGAKITDDTFAKQFAGKKLYDADGLFVSVRVTPKGKEGLLGEENRVDAISGATITSRGVDKMLYDGLKEK